MSHTQPITIPHSRNRSASQSSSSDDNSPPLKTPVSPTTPPKVTTSPSSSPILSYFLATSPIKNGPMHTSFSRSSAGNEEDDDTERPLTAHARRMSTSWAPATPRFSQTLKSNASATDAAHERGAGVLRRLSLSGAFNRPQIPPQLNGASANPLTGANAPLASVPAPPKSPVGGPPPPSMQRKPKRAATLGAAEGRQRRAPSPMGERILKGHFDGFN